MLEKGTGSSRRWLRTQAARVRVFLVLVMILLTAAAGIGKRMILAASPPCPKVLVPAYFYPGADWAEATGSKPPPSVMILDITSSGAGSSPDRTYQVAVKRAQAAGITIMGYSNTDYMQRSAAAVETDVKHYKSWYDVTDIFLDQVYSGSSGITYYRQLADYVHGTNPGSKVMLNPGTYPDRQYMSIGDIVMVFENTYAKYAGLDVPSWVDNYPAAKFAHAIYGTPGKLLAHVISLSRRRNAGYVYVTDGSGANPYSSLPNYWSSENVAIATQCA